MTGSIAVYIAPELPSAYDKLPPLTELEKLPSFDSLEEAFAYIRSLPEAERERALTINLELVRRRMEGRGRGRVPDAREARAKELMAEKGCSWKWALHLAALEVRGTVARKPGRPKKLKAQDDAGQEHHPHPQGDAAGE